MLSTLLTRATGSGHWEHPLFWLLMPFGGIEISLLNYILIGLLAT